MKTLGEALSDAKYKKVHWSHLREERGVGCPRKAGGGRLSSRLAPQASVVKGREVLEIASPFEFTSFSH